MYPACCPPGMPLAAGDRPGRPRRAGVHLPRAHLHVHAVAVAAAGRRARKARRHLHGLGLRADLRLDRRDGRAVADDSSARTPARATRVIVAPNSRSPCHGPRPSPSARRRSRSSGRGQRRRCQRPVRWLGEVLRLDAASPEAPRAATRTAMGCRTSRSRRPGRIPRGADPLPRRRCRKRLLRHRNRALQSGNHPRACCCASQPESGRRKWRCRSCCRGRLRVRCPRDCWSRSPSAHSRR